MEQGFTPVVVAFASFLIVALVLLAVAHELQQVLPILEVQTREGCSQNVVRCPDRVPVRLVAFGGPTVTGSIVGRRVCEQNVFKIRSKQLPNLVGKIISKRKQARQAA